jgi:hypothetical protein
MGDAMSAINVESVVSSRDPLPVCLSAENPHRLASLWDMLRIYAHAFVELLDRIRDIEGKLLMNAPMKAEDISVPLVRVTEDCAALELRAAHKQAVHMLQTFSGLAERGQNIPYPLIASLMADLRRWIKADLQDSVWYQIESSRVRNFYVRTPLEESPNRLELELRAASELFSPDVVNNFWSTAREIEEAAKCYVATRHTACVFHLMRVMEVGLRSLGKSLSDPDLDPKRNPSWESILRKCDSELQKPSANRSKEWNQDPVFFATAIANLRAVKDSWRNPTMHVEIDYDEERSRDVWNAVRSFMRHLATKLKE